MSDSSHTTWIQLVKLMSSWGLGMLPNICAKGVFCLRGLPWITPQNGRTFMTPTGKMIEDFVASQFAGSSFDMARCAGTGISNGIGTAPPCADSRFQQRGMGWAQN
jgi:hypothetical protein